PNTSDLMNFHAQVLRNRTLEMPAMFAHFLPWFTIHGNEFPLHPDDAATVAKPPNVDDMRHWTDLRPGGEGYHRSHHHLPTIGIYDSRSPAVITWQIETAIEFGVAGFILNWYGRNSVENVITLHWLRQLRTWNKDNPDRPFLYFISFDSQAQKASEGKTPQTMQQDFEYIRDHLMTDAYLHRDNRPVFSTFPYEDNCAEWRAALDAVFGPGQADLLWINKCPDQGENGCFPWVRPDDEAMDYTQLFAWKDPNNAGDHFLRNVYRSAGIKGRPGDYVMAGVWPGFNDQLVSWAWNPEPMNPRIRPRVIVRETRRGNTLDLTWLAYIEYVRRWAAGAPDAQTPAPLIQLITWNDYAETTTLEPTRDYGTVPLELCRQRLMEARSIWKTAMK
ncbi:MAG TPA: hypothetical protein VIH35_10090, partial [Kiritimatiellia bacterium]